MSNIEDKWINIDQVADYLVIKTMALRSWIKKSSMLLAHKVGKQWKFKRLEIDEWVKNEISAIE